MTWWCRTHKDSRAVVFQTVTLRKRWETELKMLRLSLGVTETERTRLEMSTSEKQLRLSQRFKV